MDAIIFYLSPVVGFLFMLTLIMVFVRMAAGHSMNQKHKKLLFGSLLTIVFMLGYVTLF